MVRAPTLAHWSHTTPPARCSYSYRLCPASSDLSESCFRARHLQFGSRTQRLIAPSGKLLAELTAVRTSVGTSPPGSQWTRNPIPMNASDAAPVAGGAGRGPFHFAVEDEVRAPAVPEKRTHKTESSRTKSPSHLPLPPCRRPFATSPLRAAGDRPLRHHARRLRAVVAVGRGADKAGTPPLVHATCSRSRALVCPRRCSH